jgi:hypothetical protein
MKSPIKKRLKLGSMKFKAGTTKSDVLNALNGLKRSVNNQSKKRQSKYDVVSITGRVRIEVKDGEPIILLVLGGTCFEVTFHPGERDCPKHGSIATAKYNRDGEWVIQ